MCTRRELDSILKEVAKSYRETYGSNLSRIVLYGSYARGDYRDDSDVDVVAIVRGSRKQLQDKLEKVWDISHDLSLQYGTIVSTTVIPQDEFERCKEAIPYYKNIERDGILIDG
ncbi:MAG: nucleotidyltransferase domain-containing protein [Lachnospiraceae bacterium]|nr:nucleotidyltransferase domain-containing protein [Lachnospiraceae bacterium]